MSRSRGGVWAILWGMAVGGAAPSSLAGEPAAGQLHVGWATVDITPSARVVLDGSGYKRVTSAVADPPSARRRAISAPNRSSAARPKR